MKIDFNKINETIIPAFKGGEKIMLCEGEVWWAVKNFPDTLTYAEGRIFLMI